MLASLLGIHRQTKISTLSACNYRLSNDLRIEKMLKAVDVSPLILREANNQGIGPLILREANNQGIGPLILREANNQGIDIPRSPKSDLIFDREQHS
jgi:hypothetical protein